MDSGPQPLRWLDVHRLEKARGVLPPCLGVKLLVLALGHKLRFQYLGQGKGGGGGGALFLSMFLPCTGAQVATTCLVIPGCVEKRIRSLRRQRVLRPARCPQHVGGVAGTQNSPLRRLAGVGVLCVMLRLRQHFLNALVCSG